jgi:HlyD family secretion protein
MNNRRYWEPATGAKFDITIALTSKDSRMRPGLTAHVVIHGDFRKNVLCLPRQALFLNESKRVVYVKDGNNFEPREVKILAENESRAAIDGIGVDSVVALVDPTAPRKAATTREAAPAAGGGAP